MSDRTDVDARLRRLLSDAVAEVDPSDRLVELRASVRPRRTAARSASRHTWYPLSGVVATAAVIGVITLVTNVVSDRLQDVGPATDTSTGPPSTTATAVDSHGSTPRAGSARPRPVTVYYLGDGPHGAVLFRELGTPPAGTAALAYAVRALAADPGDPDYRTPWHAGWLVRASKRPNQLTVQVGTAPAVRPASMTSRDAVEALQQVVYTVQSALGARDPVQFVRHGRPVASVLGVRTDRPVRAAPPSRTLAHLSISAPADHARIRGGRLVVSGVDVSYGPGVEVTLTRSGVTYARRAGTATDAYEPDRMFPWRVVLDTSSLPPGRYTVVASTGGAAQQDTRTVLLR